MKTMIKGLGIAVFTAMLVFVFAGCKESENDPPPSPPPADSVINISAIQGVTAPATGGTPVISITANAQYSGTVTWSPDDLPFAVSKMYRATITLTAKSGYTLQGVDADFFTVAGATTVSNPANSGVITAVFPSTSIIPITNAAVTITAPVKGVAPSTTGNSGGSSEFTVVTVSWSPYNNPYLGSAVYTAAVTLMAANGFTFNGLTTATINGQTATISDNAGTTVKLSYTFPATSDKTVIAIAIRTQPTRTGYEHGDTLNLYGFEVRLTYDNYTYDDVTFADFTAKNITTTPAHGDQLTYRWESDFRAVTVSYGSLQATTSNYFTVKRKLVNISAIQGVTAPVKGATPVTNITPNEQYIGTVTWKNTNGVVLTGNFAASTVYTATISIGLTDGYTTQGLAYNFFTVAGASSTFTGNSGITAEFPSTAPDIEMVQIPAGTFTMGSDEWELLRFSNETAHQVTLTQGFYIGKYEVTQEEYQAVMRYNPSYDLDKTAVNGESGTPGRLPVSNVSWYMALEFCNKLSMMEGLSPAYRISGDTNPASWGTNPGYNDPTWNAVEIVAGSNGYRLPTEAQWEYACRAGTTTAFNNGSTDYNENDGYYNVFFGLLAWYASNTSFWNNGYLITRSHKVGEKTANAWGLHDMHGNVEEWCWDWYGNYQSGAQTDPTGAVTGTRRVLRGGSHESSNADTLRSAYRNNNTPFNKGSLRVVRPL
jgi:formylglycine-generating enzyme required for sulfatase activity